MARVVIFGAGDIARLAHRYFSTDSPHEVIGFVVDAGFKAADTLMGLPVVERPIALERFPPAECWPRSGCWPV